MKYSVLLGFVVIALTLAVGAWQGLATHAAHDRATVVKDEARCSYNLGSLRSRTIDVAYPAVSTRAFEEDAGTQVDPVKSRKCPYTGYYAKYETEVCRWVIVENEGGAGSSYVKKCAVATTYVYVSMWCT